MSFFSGSFKKKKSSGHYGPTSPRASIDSSSRRSQGTYETSEEPPESDEIINEMFDQMLVNNNKYNNKDLKY